MWATFEFLAFDRSRRLLRIVPPIISGATTVTVSSHPRVENVPPALLEELLTSESVRLNELEFQSSDMSGSFLVSPSNECWQPPDLTAGRDISARDGKYFDIEANIRWQNVTDFPSYIRLTIAMGDSVDLLDVVQSVLNRFINGGAAIIGHAFVRSGPGGILEDEHLDAIMRRLVWTEDWRRCWYEPNDVLVGDRRRVEELHKTLGGRLQIYENGLGAVAPDNVAPQALGKVASFFLKGVLRPFVRPVNEANGEYLVNGSRLYSKGRFANLIADRLIRPLISDHVIQPMLSEQYAALIGVHLDDVISLDVHVVGASRFEQMLQHDAAVSLSSGDWQSLHVSAWTKAFGLRADIINFLMQQYFKT